MARSTVLVKYHVLYLVTRKHSWCIMFNEWFQNFVNIKLRIDLDTFGDYPNLGFAVETNSSRSHETWCKRITFNKFKFWRIIMPFTDVADSTTPIAATQVTHRLMRRHKVFPLVIVQTFIKLPWTLTSFLICAAFNLWTLHFFRNLACSVFLITLWMVDWDTLSWVAISRCVGGLILLIIMATLRITPGVDFKGVPLLARFLPFCNQYREFYLLSALINGL